MNSYKKGIRLPVLLFMIALLLSVFFSLKPGKSLLSFATYYPPSCSRLSNVGSCTLASGYCQIGCPAGYTICGSSADWSCAGGERYGCPCGAKAVICQYFPSGDPDHRCCCPVPTVAPLACPKLNTLCVSPGKIRVYWNGVPGAYSYRVYRDGRMVQLVTTNGYTDTPVSCGVRHVYNVNPYPSGGTETVCKQNLAVTCPCR